MKVNESADKDLSHFSKLTSQELYSAFESSINGLSEEISTTRLKKYGTNVIREEKKAHIVLQFLTNFKNPLVLILIVISIISLVMGSTLEAAVILTMVAMSVTLNFFQEYKANTAAEKLKIHMAHMTSVLRNGVKTEIETKYICIGDIIELNAGDMIPADCRILQSKDLFVNQSALTGESISAEKHATENNYTNKKAYELANILLHGTSVISGTANAIVLKTGANTEFGKVELNISEVDSGNEFTNGIASFSLFVFKIVIFFVIFIFLITALFKFDVLNALMFSIAVAVGLTPEFLPMIMSVNMGKGSYNMYKKGVIVKRLSSIPTLGSMDILCTDKTGTLTENEIKLVKYVDPKGNHSEQVLLYSYLNSYFETGITNIMDEAVLNFKKLDVSSYKKIDEIPFDFNRKKMTVIVEDSLGDHYLITKGAPEEIFKSSKNITDSTELINMYMGLSNDGYRVLAIATKKQNDLKERYTPTDEQDMDLIGFLAFLDPPKKDATQVIRELENLGVEIKIITGDNELVAKKICKDVELPVKGILLGYELEKLSEADLLAKVEGITLFARFSPDDKNRIITALRKNGHVVGYMGDGINDAPSLKTADVGISVSNAVDVAKETADMVITTKGLEQLKDGVLEGRKTFGNTMKYIMMGLSSNFGNMFSVLGAVLFLPFLPMLPMQILLNNFLYDFSQITIPTDKVDPEFLSKPKRWNIKDIRRFMLVFGPISSLYDFLSFFILFMLFKNAPGSFQTGWFIESLATQALVIHVIRTRKIPFLQSSASKFLIISSVLCVAIGWVLPYTPVGKLFNFEPLPLVVVGILAVVVVLYLLTVELLKRYVFKKSIIF